MSTLGRRIFCVKCMLTIVQAYVLMRVLSLTADRDTAMWNGFLLILSLFFVNILATASFVAGSTIGHITGTVLTAALVACRSGNASCRINEVALRRARLALGWVTVYRQVNHLGT